MNSIYRVYRIRCLSIICLLIPFYSYADDRQTFITPPEIELINGDLYNASDVTIKESDQQIIVNGKIKRSRYSHIKIRSKVNVEILDKNNKLLSSEIINVNRRVDKASNQRFLPFTVKLPKIDRVNYSVRVTVE